jgi:hypothetical protein
MRKLVFGLILMLALATACDFKQKAAILLGSEPIDMTNFQYVDKFPVFSVKQNIYFILVSKDPIENPKLRVQVLKTGGSYPGSIVDIVYGADINRGSDMHYVTDYFVLRKAGDYVIRIFSHDNMEKPLAETEFRVEDL